MTWEMPLFAFINKVSLERGRDIVGSRWLLWYKDSSDHLGQQPEGPQSLKYGLVCRIGA